MPMRIWHHGWALLNWWAVFGPSVVASALIIPVLEKRLAPSRPKLLIALALLVPLFLLGLSGPFLARALPATVGSLPLRYTLTLWPAPAALVAASGAAILVRRSVVRWLVSILATVAAAVLGWAWDQTVAVMVVRSLAWKVPVIGGLVVIAALLASAGRLGLLGRGLACAVAWTVAAVAVVLALRSDAYPRWWTEENICEIAEARLAPNGDLYLWVVPRVAPIWIAYRDSFALLVRRSGDARFECLSTYPLFAWSVAPDLSEQLSWEHAGPWRFATMPSFDASILASQNLVTGRHEELCSDLDCKMPEVIGPRGAWARHDPRNENVVQVQLPSGGFLAIDAATPTPPLWFSTKELKIWAGGRKKFQQRNIPQPATPQLITVDLATGAVARLAVPDLAVVEIRPSLQGEAAVLDASELPHPDLWYPARSYLLDGAGRISDLPRVVDQSRPWLVGWSDETSASLVPWATLPAIVSPYGQYGDNVQMRNEVLYTPITSILNGSGQLQTVDLTHHESKILVESLVHSQWLADSLLWVERDQIEQKVVRYWTLDARREVLLRLPAPRPTEEQPWLLRLPRPMSPPPMMMRGLPESTLR